ncbi:unnamed protein product [Heligmosomoides polygyrus]|uniref:Reverse transcriptase domain-containing protein n=1 Tax=Heligmosomoides polygyrus TaxID=6339 RepID=A0A183FLJ1_HELPZ|nr:unnamed protein product [Heligmosomoides polygyrus]
MVSIDHYEAHRNVGKYKLPLRLTFIDPKKAFYSVETHAVVGALLTQAVLTQCTRILRILRELYSRFATKILPFYNDVVDNMITNQ